MYTHTYNPTYSQLFYLMDYEIKNGRRIGVKSIITQTYSIYEILASPTMK